MINEKSNKLSRLKNLLSKLLGEIKQKREEYFEYSERKNLSLQEKNGLAVIADDLDYQLLYADPEYYFLMSRESWNEYSLSLASQTAAQHFDNWISQNRGKDSYDEYYLVESKNTIIPHPEVFIENGKEIILLDYLVNLDIALIGIENFQEKDQERHQKLRNLAKIKETRKSSKSYGKHKISLVIQSKFIDAC